MTQDQVALLLLKIVLVSGALSVSGFVALYHYLTRGSVWTNAIGRTIVIKDVLLIACLAPLDPVAVLPLQQAHLARISLWTDVVLFGLLTSVMIWRCVVWWRIHHVRVAGDAAPRRPP